MENEKGGFRMLNGDFGKFVFGVQISLNFQFNPSTCRLACLRAMAST